MKRSVLSIMFFVIYFLAVAPVAEAMVVLKTKGNKTLINLQGAQVQLDQSFNVVDTNNKTIGSLKVSNVNKDKALAVIVSGTAPEGSRVVDVSGAKTSGSKTTEVKKEKVPEGPRVPWMGSVLLGLASNTLSLKVGDGVTTENVDNTGNSVSVAVAVDRQYFQPWFRVRALVSYEQFNAIGASTINGCANQTSRDCSTDIKYLSAGGYGKFVQDFSQFQFWEAVGLNVKHPIAKSSNALVGGSIGTTAAYGLTLGADYTLETKNFITASVEKQFYIKSDSAETSTLFVRVGVGKEF